MSVKTATRPLTAFEKAIPAPILFLVDVLRSGLCLVAPILFFHLGEQLACLANGAYAPEILGVTVILDLALTLLYWAGRLRRWGNRLLTWCLSETPLRSYGQEEQS